MRLKHMTLNQKAYKILKEKIVTSKFSPGLRLHEDFLVDKLGISKTPIKLALSKLEQERLVETIPRRGTYVTQLDADKILSLWTLREVLEGLAARLSVQNLSAKDIEEMKEVLKKFKPSSDKIPIRLFLELDLKFHKTILNASKNSYLIETLENKYNLINMFRPSFASKRLNTDGPYREHIKILEAIEKNKPDVAEQTMRYHIRRGLEIFLGLPL